MAKIPKIMLFLALAFLFFSHPAQAEGQADLNKLMEETQQRSGRADEATFVWWIPQEYWQISLAQNPQITAAQAEEFIKVFSPYVLFVIVDGKVGSLGAITYKTEEDIRNSVKLKDAQGNEYLPLKDEELNQDTKNFLMLMKPMWVNALGSMGQNMHFLLFTNKNKEGLPICEAKKPGGFSVWLGEREFSWKLPLSSLMAPKVCPLCGAKLNAAYKFCPWDGTKLEE